MSKIQSVRDDNLLELFKNYVRQFNIGQIILGIAVFSLSIWCGYNVGVIFHKFLEHETIISLEMSPPNFTAFPGITVCAPSIIKPQVLAHYYPEFARQFYKYNNDKRTIKDKDFDMASDLTSIRNKLLKKFESKALSDFPAEQIIKNISVRPEDILMGCVYSPINIRNFQISKKENKNFAINSKKCTELKNLQETIFEDRKCFTYFSQLVKPNHENENFIDQDLDTTGDDCKYPHFCEKPQWSKEFRQLLKGTYSKMIYDLNPSIEILLKSIENDIWHAYVNDQIVATVHPANSMINRRESVFFQVSRSNYYEVAFTQKKTQLLEAPSKTRCVDYQKSPYFVANNISTRDQCINRCINLYKANERTCANYYSMITLKMVSDDGEHKRICDHEHQSYDAFIEARNDCENRKICPAECETYIYEVAGQLRSHVEENCKDWNKLPSTVDTVYDFKKNFEDTDNDQIYDDDSFATTNNTDTFVNGFLLHVNFSLAKPSKLANYHLPLYKWGMSVGSKSFIKNEVAYTNLNSDSSSLLGDDSNQAKCNARILIHISPKPFTLVRHQMAMSMEGFLGSIGGHIGVWLGLSLYKIIKVFVHFLYSLLTKVVRRLSPGLLAQPKQPLQASSNHGHQQ